MNSKRAWRLALTLMFGLALLGAWKGQDWLGLERVQALYHDLQAWHAKAPWTVRGAYFALYVLLASAAVPGIVVLTLAGGAVLGWGWALLLVSFASSLGATLTMLLVRHVFADALHARMGPRVRSLTRGFEREGTYYLISLRLIPLVPFGLINLVMGLTRMPVRRFYALTQCGMLPATLIYVQAGTQLAALRSVSEVLQPAVLVALLSLATALAVLPLLARRGLRWLQQRRALAPWKRPQRFDYNLVVIGAGAGGLVSAYVAAHAGARVALVESGAMGGDCLNHGCVPSKALIQSAHVAHQARQAQGYGLHTGAVQVDFAGVMARVRSVIAAIAPKDSAQRYQAMGVDVLQARALLLDPWTVQLQRPGQAPTHISARRIVLATGARPVVPDIPGLQGSGYVTSDTLWDYLNGCAQVPARVVVLGGGPVGCELAQALARLDAQVALVEAGAQLLAREDADVSALVQQALAQDGVHIHLATRAVACVPGDGSQSPKTLQVQGPQGTAALPFDLLICATGRQAQLQGMGLEALGIDTAQPLQTSAYLQTLMPTIYAAGDAAGPMQFTHAAAHQAWFATVNALLEGLGAFRADREDVPTAVFVAPQVARVGYTEQAAQARGLAYEVTLFPLAELDRALCDAPRGSAPLGFVKVLTVPGRDRMLGVCIVGEQAAELLAPYVLAMRHGLGLKAILGTVHIYPTWAESAKSVAGLWQRAHLPPGSLRWLKRWHDWRRG